MKKQPTTKPAKRVRETDSLEPLRAALKKRAKDELIDVVIEFARDSRKTQRELSRFGVEATDEALVSETRKAIIDATDFDERQVNYNFDYDYGAYRTVERNFRRLVKAGQLEQAMELSLELMRLGSYQVEMSDEGMMTEDVEACWQVVLKAVTKSKLPPTRIVAWCEALRKSDGVGFILDKEIRAVKNRFETVSTATPKQTPASA